MKRISLIALLSFITLCCSAQMFVWKDGVVQYALRTSTADSITFYEPADYGEIHPVDLGLPSGIKWADKNLGATAPSEVGTPYAWGEVVTKETFTEENYVGLGTKYFPKQLTGRVWYSNGALDEDYNLPREIITNRLLLEEDAAHILLGGAWRLPTYEECQELLNEKSNETTSMMDGVEGLVLRFSNDANLFFPFSGGGYSIWSSSHTLFYPYTISIDNGILGKISIQNMTNNYNGFYVRPVYDESLVNEQQLPNSLVFSIGQDKYVYFSSGNLQYQANTNTFRFALNQYDVIGLANNNISVTNPEWIDLFEWGCGNNPSHICPDLISDRDNNRDFIDFGSNVITDGNISTPTGSWRTLSYQEWEYVIYHRRHANQLKGTATVNGMFGLIILPDGWQLPTGSNFTPIFDNGTMNQYTTVEWQTMEAAGAIFLPAGGRRGSTTISKVGECGLYWSSNALEDFYGVESRTFMPSLLYIKNNSAYMTAGFHTQGLSVRLVKDYVE